MGHNSNTIRVNLSYLKVWCFSRLIAAADSSTDEDSKELNTAACAECMQAASRANTHSYKKSLRLSSDQIVRCTFDDLFIFFY